MASWFRFGDGYLELESADGEFQARFVDLYRDCRCDPPEPDAAVVRCSVHLETDERVRIVFDDPEPLDSIPFAQTALADAGYEEVPSAPPRRMLRSHRQAGTLVFEGSTILADAASPWPSIAASLALHRVLRLQRGHFFLHAGSVAVAGQGFLLCGPKEAGKTTLSLALADRGHDFFGDEVAAIRRDTLELVPFRRRLSIRPGPATASIETALAIRDLEVVTLDDGTPRTRVQPSDVIPGAVPATVPMRAIFFLRTRVSTARATRFRPVPGDVARLAPYESANWGSARATTAMAMWRMLGQVRCYHLEPGPIDETVRLIETLAVEDP